MIVFSTILVALGIAYAIALIRFTTAFRALPAAWNPQAHDRMPSVTVIVAARNEEAQITSCLRSIADNDYPPELVEIVVVDDGSSDETADIVAALSREDPRVKLVGSTGAENDKGGKRQAIALGIGHSTGEIILLTDADCSVPPAWIGTMTAGFDEDTRFVAGPVAYSSGRTWLGRVLELELLGLVVIGGGAIALGRPNMCNGANVAFRRSAFREVGGYSGTESVTSGDDELLMQKMERTYPGSVAFCPDPDALVETKASEGLLPLFQQRKRWASKGLHYQEKRITGLAILVYLFNLLLLAAIVAGLFAGPLLTGLTVAILLKIGAEAWLFWTACGRFGRMYLLPWMIPGQLFEIPYVVVVGAAGAVGGYRWKGRYIQR